MMIHDSGASSLSETSVIVVVIFLPEEAQGENFAKQFHLEDMRGKGRLTHGYTQLYEH